MNAEVFSALTHGVSKLREMKKAHEEMAAELARLRAEKEQAGSKYSSLISVLPNFLFRSFRFISHSPFSSILNR